MRLLLATGLIGAAIFTSLTAGLANPKGGQVTAGSATVSNSSPVQLDIVQSTNRAVIDWQSFDIAVGERTKFQQPSAAAMTLNRVHAADPSTIAGQLTANGSLVLINPNGIVFSKGSQVNVNSIIATPSDIANANFMASNLPFDRQSPNPNASIVNAGTITVAQKGLAALVAPSVVNSGVIQAKLGKVVLAGAETFTLDFYGDGLISFDVGPKVTTVPLGANGKPVTSLVSNTGTIDAPGGNVLLTADAVAGILENVIDSPGQITAPTTPEGTGTVTLDAGTGNGARLAGTIDVSGAAPGQTGGTAIVTGGAVNFAGTAQVKARGPAGGGTVKIGGGPHGTDTSVRNALNTVIDAGALIDASATDSGNGGNVAVWSDGTTVFNGTILAKGGPDGGNGGWVETSGHALSIASSTVVDASAPAGKAGTWLLDPTDLTVAAADSNINDTGPAGATDTISPTASPATVANTTIQNALNTGNGGGGSNVVLTTIGSPNSGVETGAITVNAPISWTTATTLTLNAAGNIAINAGITGSNASSVLALTAGGTVSQSGTGTITVGTLITSSIGDTTLGLANAVGSFNATNTTAGDISLANTASPLTVTGVSQTGGGNVTIGNTGALALTGTVSADGGAVNLTASGALSENGAGLVSTTGLLTTSSASGATLGGANTVATFNATNTTSGNFP